ncbi:MAG: hypothetical protein CJBNEKGG_01639 [Prosthecobacter sp.]|nr:hypothetical protein [Prosthecobacter sp.]
MLRFLLFMVLASSLPADVAVPQRVLQPQTVEEAWNVIRQVTANVDRLDRERRALEVAGQISLISPSLRLMANQTGADGGMMLTEPQSVQAFQLVNQIARHSMADNAGALSVSFRALRRLLDDVADGLRPELRSAEIHSCPLHGEVTGKGGENCASCQRPLKPRRIPYSFIHARPEKPTVKMVISRPLAARAGEEVRLEFELRTLDGRPVEETDLWLMHAQAVQVMVAGPCFEEFHHLTATTKGGGRYEAAFTPAHGGDYRLLAGATPAETGLPEYPFALLKVEGAALPPRPAGDSSMSVQAEGFRFSLTVKGARGNQLRAGQTQALQLQVSDLAGQPVTRLEPVHQAFAHLHGFFTDTGTVLQLHPVGGDILREDARGGPALVFKIYSPEAGQLRFYAQVRIDGRVILAPLTVMVHP